MPASTPQASFKTVFASVRATFDGAAFTLWNANNIDTANATWDGTHAHLYVPLAARVDAAIGQVLVTPYDLASESPADPGAGFLAHTKLALDGTDGNVIGIHVWVLQTTTGGDTDYQAPQGLFVALLDVGNVLRF